ncbi:MAG: hypothetical protein DBX40_06355 [Clostridiales bacterium]|nr:MAG: hypothetical protein DBX40_06355 [Clostridiales bacterium]
MYRRTCSAKNKARSRHDRESLDITGLFSLKTEFMIAQRFFFVNTRRQFCNVFLNMLFIKILTYK